MPCPSLIRTTAALALAGMLAGSVPARAQAPNLGAEFVLFVDSTNAIIPDVEPVLAVDPDDSANPVLRFDYGRWASVALAFDEAVGADMRGLLDKSLHLRMRVDSGFAGRGPCIREDAGDCLSLILFDSFSGPQDRQSIQDGSGDAGFRLKWFIPDSLRDGRWHTLSIPLPPETFAELDAQRPSLEPQARNWYYTGAWTGTYGIGCCGSSMPTSQDSLWREFDWSRVARVGVHFDWSDHEAGSIYLDDLYIGDAYTDVSGWGTPAPVEARPESPVNGAVDQPAEVTLRWTGRRGAAHTVQVSRDSGFTQIDRELQVMGDSVRASGLTAYATYHWRVRAEGRSEASEWGESFTFTVGGISAPQPIEPADGATGLDPAPAFVWSEVPGGISYRLQVDLDAQFDTPVVDEAGIPAPGFEAPSLTPGTEFYWRVRAESAQGPGNWSPVSTFETAAIPPEAPSAGWPPDGVVEIPSEVTLTWNAAVRAQDYRIQLSENGDFGSTMVDDLTENTEYTVSGLQRSGTYHWRVRAENSGGVSEWMTRRFETQLDPPAASQPVLPEDGSVDQALRVLLRWEAIETAAHYRVQVSHSVTFDNLAVDTVAVAADSVLVGPLRSYRVHFWRVQAANRGGESPWSPVFNFRTTQNEPPSAFPDRVEALEDVPVDVRVLSNDSDPDGDPLVVASAGTPAHGYAYLASPTVVRYAPPENWSGVDSLSYVADDGKGGQSESWVVVNVSPVNDPPEPPAVMLPLPGTMLNVQGDPTRLFRVLWNPVSDIDSDSVTYSWELATSVGFTPVLYATPFSGETSTSITYGDLAASLTGAGVATHQSTVAYHRIVAFDGESHTAGPAEAMPVTRGAITASEGEGLPTEFDVGSVYPNPVQETARFSVGLPAPARIRYRIVDALGRSTVLGSGPLVDAGWHRIELDLANVPAGFYLLVVEAGSHRIARPLLRTR